MTPETKAWIDSKSYEDLLEFWRFSPPGTPIFCDTEIFDYYTKVMKEKERAIASVDRIEISKRVGWNR